MMHEEPADRKSKRSYWVVGGALVLGLLVGLGIGMVVAGEAEAESEVTIPAAVEELHAAWYAAWNEADGETVQAMMAPGGRHYCPGTGIDGAGGDELAEFVDKGFTVADVETVGTISVNTPGDPSGASKDHFVVTQLTLDGHPDYLSVLHLRGQEDSLHVLAHRAFP